MIDVQVDIFEYLEPNKPKSIFGIIDNNEHQITTIYADDCLLEVIITVFIDFGRYERKRMWFKSISEKKEFLSRYDIQSRKKSDFKDVEIILVKERISHATRHQG